MSGRPEGRIYQWSDLTQSQTIRAEVCVIGSGCGGATVAKKLAEAGRDVVILERGGYYPESAFDQSEIGMNAKLSADRSMRASADGGTLLLSGHNVGGASVHYWADSYRTPQDRLALWADRYGVQGHDLAALMPAWDELTATLNVHPATDEYHNRMNQLLREGAHKLGWEGHPVPQARKHCVKSGHCMQGCVYRAKQSQLVTHIPQAVALGARVYADVEAHELLREQGKVRRLVARVVHRPSNRVSDIELTIDAKVFVVAAGGYYSAPFLMKQGLGRQLPMLGRSFGMNPTAMVHGLYDEDIVLWRNIPAAFGVEQFRLARHDEAGRYVEGGYLLMANQIQPGLLGSMMPLMGATLGEWMGQMKRVGGTIAWIDDPADELGELKLAKDGTPKVEYPYGPKTQAILRDTIRKQAQIQFAVGARRLLVAGADALLLESEADLAKIDALPIRAGGLYMAAPHPSGGCIMGRSAKDSVTDSTHRVHGFDNLFVADSSVFPTPVSVDPSFTIMAFSYVAARHIDEHLD
ncbi:GMC family oxidoreductase [Fontimonas sp. SYSU GA230001]|uniref:GMC family oxidoreductase n=1 Tax=Fontimonas sp. SYSU GA230001 TaxID=3142450 RepID=UPI0032B368F9